MSEDRARLFVALELPAAARSALAGWTAADVAGGRAEVRAVSAESLHVTLCFLDSRPSAEVPSIGTACDVVAGMAAASLTVGPAVCLPSPRRPRVVAVRVVDRTGALAAVQARLAGALADGGFYAAEARPFLAHVTVARVRGPLRLPPEALPAPPALTFIGGSVALMRSRLGQGPARYERLHAVRLASERGG